MSGRRLEFLVARRGHDPAAETCATALRDLLGAAIVEVERGEFWRFEFASAGDAATRRERLLGAACRAGRYVNLNRDACAWLAAPRPYPAAASPTGCAVDVWVVDGDGRDAAALAWFRAQAEAELADLRRGILWRLWLPESDPRAARRAAEAIAVTRDRRHGLLANPLAQTAEILAVVPGPEAMKESA